MTYGVRMLENDGKFEKTKKNIIALALVSFIMENDDGHEMGLFKVAAA